MINQGSDPPQVIAPVALPQHMLTFRRLSLAAKGIAGLFSKHDKEIPVLETSAPDLFDAAIWQSQPLTRLRGRLLAESIQRLASIVFYVEGRYKSIADQSFMGIEKGEADLRKLESDEIMDSYDAYLDEGSLRVLSGAALKSVVATMAKANLLPTEFVLDTFDIPNAKEFAEDKMQELAGDTFEAEEPR